jgi:glycosyltransferase involved in cell wall biosynthesis
VILDAVTGFLVASDDIAAAAEAVARTAELSRSRCRDHAESHLDLELSLDAHEQLYARAARAGLEVAAGG